MRRRRKTDLARAKEKADKAWAYKVKERAGWRCEKCGVPSPTMLHAHHFISRNYSRLRFDVRNGVALCAKDHLFGRDSAHKGGPIFASWFFLHRPEDYAYVMLWEHRQPLAQNRTAQDYLDIAASLEPESEGMEDAA